MKSQTLGEYQEFVEDVIKMFIIQSVNNFVQSFALFMNYYE